jgi:hypothetical protein
MPSIRIKINIAELIGEAVLREENGEREKDDEKEVKEERINRP